MEIQLSPIKTHTTTFWKSLNLADDASLDWSKAIDIFKHRIEGRFLGPVKAIEQHVDKNIRVFSGFAIMAIDCLLIETLNQFYLGINETNDGYRGTNAKAFFDFFSNSKHFDKYFDSLDKAMVFYRQIRCGILHQAQTKAQSTINANNSNPMIEWVNVNTLDEGLRINRLKFHSALTKEFEDYLERLKDQANKKLRANFINKMNFVAG